MDGWLDWSIQTFAIQDNVILWPWVRKGQEVLTLMKATPKRREVFPLLTFSFHE